MIRLAPSHSAEALQTAIETRFECLRCGHCCKGDGVVRIGPAEADRMAAALGLARSEFLKQYARCVGRERWHLLDRWVEGARPGAPREQWCVFLERSEEGADKGLYGCRVNAAKPDQCARFPATWRNPESLRTCAGLRALLADMRAEDNEAPPNGAE